MMISELSQKGWPAKDRKGLKVLKRTMATLVTVLGLLTTLAVVPAQAWTNTWGGIAFVTLDNSECGEFTVRGTNTTDEDIVVEWRSEVPTQQYWDHSYFTVEAGDTKSQRFTYAEDTNGGTVEVSYRMQGSPWRTKTVDTDCDSRIMVHPVKPPSFTEGTLFTEPKVNLPNQTGVTYTITPSDYSYGDKVTVRAEPKPGYRFKYGDWAQWYHTFDEQPTLRAFRG